MNKHLVLVLSLLCSSAAMFAAAPEKTAGANEIERARLTAAKATAKAVCDKIEQDIKDQLAKVAGDKKAQYEDECAVFASAAKAYTQNLIDIDKADKIIKAEEVKEDGKRDKSALEAAKTDKSKAEAAKAGLDQKKNEAGNKVPAFVPLFNAQEKAKARLNVAEAELTDFEAAEKIEYAELALEQAQKAADAVPAVPTVAKEASEAADALLAKQTSLEEPKKLAKAALKAAEDKLAAAKIACDEGKAKKTAAENEVAAKTAAKQVADQAVTDNKEADKAEALKVAAKAAEDLLAAATKAKEEADKINVTDLETAVTAAAVPTDLQSAVEKANSEYTAAEAAYKAKYKEVYDARDAAQAKVDAANAKVTKLQGELKDAQVAKYGSSYPKLVKAQAELVKAETELKAKPEDASLKSNVEAAKAEVAKLTEAVAAATEGTVNAIKTAEAKLAVIDPQSSIFRRALGWMASPVTVPFHAVKSVGRSVMNTFCDPKAKLGAAWNAVKDMTKVVYPRYEENHFASDTAKVDDAKTPQAKHVAIKELMSKLATDYNTACKRSFKFGSIIGSLTAAGTGVACKLFAGQSNANSALIGAGSGLLTTVISSLAFARWPHTTQKYETRANGIVDAARKANVSDAQFERFTTDIAGKGKITRMRNFGYFGAYQLSSLVSKYKTPVTA